MSQKKKREGRAKNSAPPCQSGLTQYALRRFCQWGRRCSLPGWYSSQIFRHKAETTFHFVKDWTGNTLVKFYVATIIVFKIQACLVKNVDFAKNWPMTFQTGWNSDLGYKRTTSREYSFRAIRFFPLSCLSHHHINYLDTNHLSTCFVVVI